MDIKKAIAEALFQNELSGNPRAIYRFAKARGGNSGYSFGRCQFDVSNNITARMCLKECGFLSVEIQLLQTRHGGDLDLMDQKLLASAAIVDRYDAAQVDTCFHHVTDVLFAHKINIASEETIVHLADYHNQFDLSPNGKMAEYLSALGRAVTPSDVLEFKLHRTKWGATLDGEEDIMRRYHGCVKACTEQA